jgi:hypothetical protein
VKGAGENRKVNKLGRVQQSGGKVEKNGQKREKMTRRE